MADREALRQRLLVVFKVEAREHAATLSSGLIQLETAPPGVERAKLVELVFREAHSLKGAARSVNVTSMESVCQALETVFSEMKREKLEVSRALLDVLLDAVRTIERLLNGMEAGEPTDSVSVAAIVSALRGTLETSTRGSDEPQSASKTMRIEVLPSSVTTGAGAVVADTVRVPTRKLDRVRLHAEELFAERIGLVEHADEIQRIHSSVSKFRKTFRTALREARSPVRERLGRPSLVGNQEIAGFLEAGASFLEELERRTALLERAARRNQRSVASRAEHLLGESLDLLMLPCAWLLDGFAHVVRDLGRDQNKEVALAIHGSALEVDRRILTELRDPVLHALRNAVDHGIELPAERKACGKPSCGTVSIAIEQVSGQRVSIRISDDGRGVDPARVLAAALRLGVLDAEAAAKLDPEAVLNLVFESDLTTNPDVTDLSGRGLGLAIFREKVATLGGTSSITTQPLLGTTLSMLLPISIATFRGVVVRVQDRVFVLPTASVERVIGVRPDQLRTVENRSFVEIAGASVAVVSLGHALGMPSVVPALPSTARLPMLVVSVAKSRIAFLVDEIVGEKDALAKNLGPHLRGVSGVLGASQLGNGKIALILDPNELVRRAAQLEPAALPSLSLMGVKSPMPSILVAEDSITSRTLLKSILESAGYSVVTAVDGMDAFEKLRSASFDLLVSDIDMPRLNGLGLTQRVRADQRLAELPVVLVTSLESREDRERGIDVGANAYLVKQSFDQSNLLAAIARLL